MCKLPTAQQLLQMPKKTELFGGDPKLAEKNKELAKSHLLQIQLLLAKRPIK